MTILPVIENEAFAYMIVLVYNNLFQPEKSEKYYNNKYEF